MNRYEQIKVIPVRELYYHDDYGVYACEVDETVDIEKNKFGNIVINGVLPQLTLGREYIVNIKEVNHKVYGKGYEVESIRQELPRTIEEKHIFLRSILPESYAEALIEAYPNDEDIITKIREGTLDYSKIKGIGHIVFKKIQNIVNENYEIHEALIELSKYGITYRIIKKLINHFGGSPTLVVQKVKENVYCLTEVDYLGFMKVNEYALNNGIPKDSPYRIEAAIEYVLKEEESDGHCWVTKNHLIERTAEITNLNQDVIKEFVEGESFKNIKKFYSDNDKIGLYRNYYYEFKIAEILKKLMQTKGNFKVDNFDQKINQIQKEQGFEFTDEQLNAIKKAIEENVLIISGRAGSGKTSILKAIIKLLDKYSYETCALSGKAAQRIIESTGLQSKTIHRLLGFTPQGGFTYNHENRLPVDIVVLDECSMVNNQLFYNLISAIKDGGKFIIIGDIEQLPPIGAGTILKDMIDSGVIPVVELTKVHRQALKSGILLAANHIRDGHQITKNNEFETKIIGELKDLIIYPCPKGTDIQSKIVNLCLDVKNKINIMDFQVIVPLKTRGSLSTKELNNILQPIFNENTDEGIKRNGYEFKVGDKIIKRGNDYDNGVFNGTLGTVKWIDKDEGVIGFRFIGMDKEVAYGYEDLKTIELAYALTCHSTQGSQFKYVLLALDYSAYTLLNRQWVYTGITRASEKCVFIFENAALRFAISKNDIIKRNTFLKDLLVQELESVNQDF